MWFWDIATIEAFCFVKRKISPDRITYKSGDVTSKSKPSMFVKSSQYTINH